MKLQISLEFLLVFSFVLTIFLILFAIVAARGAELSNQQVFSQTQLVAQTVAQEINTAYNSGNGYSGNTVLASGYGINPYNITILPNGEIIVTAQEAQQKIQSIAFSQARNILVGNVINTGSITVQNFFGAVCVDTACPTPSNYASVVSLSTQLVHAAKFNGAASTINTGITGLPTSSAARSVFAWVYEPASSVTGDIYSYGTASGDGLAAFGLSSGKVWFSTYSHGGNIGSLPVPPNTWAFVGFTYSGGTYASGSMTGYLNGQSSTSWSNPITPSTASGYSTIGAYNLGTSYQQPFNGMIADIQVYNVSLSATAVNTLYSEGITGVPILPANIVGWWPLNGNAYDYSGNNNAGTVNNIIFPSVSELQAAVSDAYGHPINGILVGFSTTQGVFTHNAFTASYATNGIAVAFVTQNLTNGVAIINATVYPGSLGEQANLTAWWPLNQTFST